MDYCTLMILIISLCTAIVNCEVLTISAGVALSTLSGYVYYNYKCRFYECCDDTYVPFDVEGLDNALKIKLFGQHIAHQTIINALRGHLELEDPPKALAMSFHGTPGTGKNYVARMITNTFYKKGEQSEYVHIFNGRNDFPLQSRLDEYKVKLTKQITDSLVKCPQSLFIFDEVDKMPEGLLNVLVPFIDYRRWYKSFTDSPGKHVPTNKAIYIFLSNKGSIQIVKQLLQLWSDGRSRLSITLRDFENLISAGAFEEKGGFHYSDAIQSNVIDHYVPFLPLEEKHVIRCVEEAFASRNASATTEMIKEVMSYVTFEPPVHKLYATSGCKRLHQKVASTIYRYRTEDQ